MFTIRIGPWARLTQAFGSSHSARPDGGTGLIFGTPEYRKIHAGIVVIIAGMLCLLSSLSTRADSDRTGTPTGWSDAEIHARTAQQFARHGVELRVQETAGVTRHADPVTSGVPLPLGCITNASPLSLLDARGQAIPCQFTPQSLWPDGSIKWVLVDFQADVAASNSAAYRLCTTKEPGRTKYPADHVSVEDKSDRVEMRTGPLRIEISKVRGTVMEIAEFRGKSIVGTNMPVDVVLRLEDGSIYRTSLCKPDLVEIEDKGFMRGCVRVKGKFAGPDAKPLLRGKISYDMRITGYAGKPWVKLEFTFENRGGQYNRKEWLYIKELSMDFPILSTDISAKGSEFQCSAGRYKMEGTNGISFTQWLKYPPVNNIGWQYGAKSNNWWRAEHELKWMQAAGMEKEYQGFYCVVRRNEHVEGHGRKGEGWCTLRERDKELLALSVKRFWENFPKGFGAANRVSVDGSTAISQVSCLILPEGGFYPRSDEMTRRVSYRYDGQRAKTTEILVNFGPFGEPAADWHKEHENRLVARPSLKWYADTAAIWPVAPVVGAGAVSSAGTGGGASEKAETTGDESGMSEAVARFERLQRAKVYAEEGDFPDNAVPPGFPASLEHLVKYKISITSARERMPDVFYGSMNFGDLVWGFGYCSLFYDWPYGMLLQYLRHDDRIMFEISEDMAHHRYDIDRAGPWQHYEKGYHGHVEWIDSAKYRRRGGYNPKPSHTWCRGLFLHWALTGDSRSLETAEENARAFFHLLDRNKEKEVDYPEFRTPGWAIEACLAMYEYRGHREYLEKAREIFERTLLAMERKNGSRGHLIAGGKQSAQFVSFIIEPVARLHWLTGDEAVAGFLRRVLNWEMKNAMVYGDMKDGKYRPLACILDWERAEEHPDEAFALTRVYGFQFADGYAYLHQVTGEQSYLEFARRLFRDTMFYYGEDGFEVAKEKRTPLGFHMGSRRAHGWAPKFHAFTSRYGQITLQEMKCGDAKGKASQ